MTSVTQYSNRMRVVAAATMAMFAWSGFATAQAPAPATPPPADNAAAGASVPAFSQQELEQLVAPVALYPDSLLAQVLMASTYPLEIVSAERWVKANPKLKDKALEDALQKQTWDASVKSLAVFPQVLTMMSEKIDWTQKLGDAFLAQPKEVMDTAQALRAKAVKEGSLKDSNEQKVVTEKTESTTIIKIEPTNPEVVYVPTYNPTVVYGAWPYPAYPPYYYYPPGYVAGGALLGFTAGVIVGGALWGNMGWGNNNVNINVNKYNNFNKTNVANGNWQHNASHRGAVPYKDQRTAQQYNRDRGGGAGGAQNRDAYRGRDGGGGQQFSRDGGGGRGGDVGSNRAGGGGDFGANRGSGAGSFDRGGAQVSNRDVGGGGGGGRSSASAFDTGSRSQTMSASNRGASSMGASRGGGGGARAGGGGGGRGGGGRR